MSFIRVRKRVSVVLPIIALFLITLVFFSDILKIGYLFIERDLAVYFIPPRFFWVESMKAGEFPFWNSLSFGGYPFFATLQPAMLYPPNVLFFILPFNSAFNWIIIIHFFLAGVFAFALLRHLGADQWSSFFGASSFLLGGYLLSLHNLLSALLSVAWTPLIILFFSKALRQNSLWQAVWAGVFLTVSFLGGGVEVVLSICMVLAIMTLFPRWLGGGDVFQAGKALAVTGLVFLGLSAVQMLPFLELVSNSIRKNGMAYGEAVVWSASPVDLLSFLIPDPYGSMPYGPMVDMKKYWERQSWLKTLYVGTLPLILAVYYGIKGEKKKTFWLALIAISVFLALGGNNPLYPYLYKYIPVVSKIRYPVKFLFLAVLALSVMGGLGFHRLLEAVQQGKSGRFGKTMLVMAVGASFLLLGLNLAHDTVLGFLKAWGWDEPVYNAAAVNLHNTERMLVYFVFGCMGLWFIVKRKGAPYAVGALCLILIFDLFGNYGYYSAMSSAAYWHENWTVRHVKADLGDHRVFVTPATGTSTFIAPAINVTGYPQRVFFGASSLNYHIRNMRGGEVMRVKRTDDLLQMLTASPSIDATRIIDLFSVKYVISTKPISSPHVTLVGADIKGLEGDPKELLKENTIKLYLNKRVLPRTLLVKDYRVQAEPAAALAYVSRRDFDPTKTVVLEEKPIWDPGIPSTVIPKGSAGAKILHERNNEIELQARVARPSLLYLADTFYIGWNAYVDGKKTKIYRANYNFRAVPLPPGEHHVEFRYQPLSFCLGAGITGATLLLLIALGVKSILGKGHKTAQPATSQTMTPV